MGRRLPSKPRLVFSNLPLSGTSTVPATTPSGHLISSFAALLPVFTLVRGYYITGWVIPSLRNLVCQKEAMTLRDAELLGVETTLVIASLAEKHGVLATISVKERREAEVDMSKAYRSHLNELQSMHDVETVALKLDIVKAQKQV